LRAKEIQAGLERLETYPTFWKKLNRQSALLSFLIDAKAQGKVIAALVSGKGNAAELLWDQHRLY